MSEIAFHTFSAHTLQKDKKQKMESACRSSYGQKNVHPLPNITLYHY